MEVEPADAKVVKKRGGGGRKPKTTEVVPEQTSEGVVLEQTSEVVEVEPAAEKVAKKRGGGGRKPKDTEVNNEISNNDEVVIPVQEQLQLHHIEQEQHEPELDEEPFEEEQEEETVDLIEHFVNDVLYYVDNQGNWFDSLFQPIQPPK